MYEMAEICMIWGPGDGLAGNLYWSHQTVTFRQMDSSWCGCGWKQSPPSLGCLQYLEAREMWRKQKRNRAGAARKAGRQPGQEQSWEPRRRRLRVGDKDQMCLKLISQWDDMEKWPVGLLTAMLSRPLIGVYPVELWGQTHQQRAFEENNSRDICKCRQFIPKLCSETKERNGAVREEAGTKRGVFKWWAKK